MKNATSLVNAVIEKQNGESLNDNDMALKLGISEAYWNRLRSGERQAGVKFLSSVLRIYPEMRILVEEYITNRNDHGDKS